MRGYYFKNEVKTRQHLADDYRDPELPALPLIPKFVPKRESCGSVSTSSLKNVLSDPWLIDHMDLVGLKERKPLKEAHVDVGRAHPIAVEKTEELHRGSRSNHYDTETAMDELLADGYVLSREIMAELFKRDTAVLDGLKTVLNKNDAKRPPLRNSRDAEFIVSALKIWEIEYKRNKKAAASKMLYLALYFQKREDPTYHWLVYELYHLALRSLPSRQRSLTEALILYLFGSFLVDKAKHYKEAQKHLERACELSYGYNWTTTFLTGQPDHIHDMSAYQLHVLLIKKAVKKSFKHPLEAVDLAKKALQYVKRANNEEALADSYFDLAVMYNRAHMPERANLIVQKALEIFESREDVVKICASLIFKSHCLRRMEDYKEAVKTLMSVVDLSKLYAIPSMEGKACKHLGEYFIGREEYRMAYGYMKKSADLLAESDLKDELDEAISMLSYIKGWMSLKDVLYIVSNGISVPQFFDFVDFVEVGIPHLGETPALEFAYVFSKDKVQEHSSKELEEMSPVIETLSEEESLTEEERSGDTDDNELEYFAFSDLMGTIYDEELDQVAAMFERARINKSSEVVLRVLQETPIKQRSSKKAEIGLLAKEIAETQKLLCLQQKMYEPALFGNDKVQVGKKMRLAADDQETGGAENEETDGQSLWDCSVEIRANWEPFSRWVVEASSLARRVGFEADSGPGEYQSFLDGLLSLVDFYRKYQKTVKPTDMREPILVPYSTENLLLNPSNLKYADLEASEEENTPISEEAHQKIEQSIPKVVCRCKEQKEK